MGRHNRRKLLSQEAYRKGVEAKAAANQPSNANNPPTNVPPTKILTNQNLQNSAASAAALPLLKQINSTPTNANIDASHSEAMDTSLSVMPQTSQPAA
jgi:hypothetical protein